MREGSKCWWMARIVLPILNLRSHPLGRDYFGTSLHKWLAACIGSGMVYVKKDKIAGLYPLFAAGDPKSPDIRKFENLGTRPFFIEQAAGKAIGFYDMIGPARKEKRLFYLKNYWMTAVKDIPKVKFYTSHEARIRLRDRVGAVSRVRRAGQLDNYLFENYRIHAYQYDVGESRGGADNAECLYHHQRPGQTDRGYHGVCGQGLSYT